MYLPLIAFLKFYVSVSIDTVSKILRFLTEITMLVNISFFQNLCVYAQQKPLVYITVPNLKEFILDKYTNLK